MKMRSATFLLGLVVLWPLGLIAQAKPLKDKDLLAQFIRTNPCPKVLPAAWLRPDSTLGRSPLCPVVAAAAAHLAASPDSVHRWIVANAACTIVLTLEGDLTPVGGDLTTHTSVAIWSVKFVARGNQVAEMVVDRETGTMRTPRAPSQLTAQQRSRCGSGV